jgi:hypothetical protein
MFSAETDVNIKSSNTPRNDLLINRKAEAEMTPHRACELGHEALSNKQSESCDYLPEKKNTSSVDIGELVLSSKQLESITINTIYEFSENNILLGESKN